MGFLIRSILLALAQSSSVASQSDDWILAPAGNNCPSGYAKIFSFVECQYAVGVVDPSSKFRGSEMERAWPKGCYHCDDVANCQNGAWFNAHSSGSDVDKTQPYCKRDGADAPIGINPVVFVGDSDISYWDTNAWLPSPQSYNLGRGGDTCKQAGNTDEQVISDYQPSQVVLVCGENDLASGVAPGKTFKRFKSVLNEFKAAGVRMIYLGTKPERDSRKLWKKYRQYDQKVRKLVQKLAKDASPPLVMIDSYKGFMDIGNSKSLYKNDQLHLSNLGYAYWKEWSKLALDDTTGCAIWRNGRCTFRFQSRRLFLV